MTKKKPNTFAQQREDIDRRLQLDALSRVEVPAPAFEEGAPRSQRLIDEKNERDRRRDEKRNAQDREAKRKESRAALREYLRNGGRTQRQKEISATMSYLSKLDRVGRLVSPEMLTFGSEQAQVFEVVRDAVDHTLRETVVRLRAQLELEAREAEEVRQRIIREG